MISVTPQNQNGFQLSLQSRYSSKIFDQIRYLMILRVVIITTFMIVALPLLYETGHENILWFIVGLIILLYFLTIIYSLFLYRIKNLSAFAYFQISGDILFETGLIYISGPIYSPLVFLYIISIIAAGILLSTQGSYIIASLSCILYGLLSALHQNEIIPSLNIFGFIETSFSTGDLLYKLFINFCSFYLVAFLSNHLIKNLRKAGEELNTKKEDLLRLQKLNENILRSIDSGLIAVNLEGKIATFNLAAERLTGYSEKEVIGQAVSRILPIDDLIDFRSMDKLSEQLNRFEHMFKTKDDRELYLGFSISNLYDEHGKNTGYIIIFQDLTDYKKLEHTQKKNEKMAILGELAARMAHEIRNPLTSMKGSIEIISKESTIQASNKKLVDIILRESERLNRLISDFLQYAQPRKIMAKRFSITDVLKELIILLANHPRMDNRINLELLLPDDDIWLYGDMFQIKQVFLNLCLNSLDAMPSGGTLSLIMTDKKTERVILSMKPDFVQLLDQKCYVAILVKDSGQGIPAKYKDQIFTPFFSTKESGTGLGLAIAYRIVENHNGQIDYISLENTGTTFIVLLPKDKSA
ncbi:PAS domain S-box protein [bacterium]|nr:PAS domain S-box protein [bacterium]